MGPACWWLTVFRLSAAGRRFALTSFAVKVAIFWIAQLGVCVLDPRRMVCGVVERGFLPCLISFASAKSKKKLKQLSRDDYDFIYLEIKGWLCFDRNDSDNKWGNSDEGGLVAILKGKPELTAEDITLLA